MRHAGEALPRGSSRRPWPQALSPGTQLPFRFSRSALPPAHPLGTLRSML